MTQTKLLYLSHAVSVCVLIVGAVMLIRSSSLTRDAKRDIEFARDATPSMVHAVLTCQSSLYEFMEGSGMPVPTREEWMRAAAKEIEAK